MKHVVSIDPSEIISDGKSLPDGSRLFVSPANVPEYVESDYNENDAEFVIHFIYPGTEPTVEKRVDQYTYQVGVNSGRLYSIRLKTNRHDKFQLGRDLKKAMIGIVAQSAEIGRSRWGRGSLDAVQSILTAHSNEIFQPRFG